MADQYAVAAGGNWSAATTWESGPGNGDDTGPPLAAEQVLLVVGSGDVAIDGATNALGSFDSTNYGGTLAVDNALDIDGNAVFGTASAYTGSANITVAGSIIVGALANFSSYTGTLIHDDAGANVDALTTNGATLPDFQVDNAGVTSFTLQDAMACGDFTMGAGKFTDGGNTVTFSGDLVVTAGAPTTTGVWSQASGAGTSTVRWGVSGSPLFKLSVAQDSGDTANITTLTVIKRFQYGAGAVVLTDGLRLSVSNSPMTGAWTDGTGSVTTAGTGSIRIITFPDNALVGPLSIDVNIQVLSSPGRTLKQAGDWIIGSSKVLQIEPNGNGVNTFDMNGFGFKGSITNGDTAALDRSGIVKCGEGIVQIGNLIDGNAANLANDFQLESCYLECSGTTLDFANMTHSAADDDVVHIVCLAGADVANFAPVEIVHVHGDGSVDNGSGTGANGGAATFNIHAPPGSARLLGVGV